MQSLSRATALRRDPAPSRWAYRMQRLWLTPRFRFFLRHGVPVLVVTLAVAIFTASPARRDSLWDMINAAKTQVTERPMFMVNLLSIEGASSDLSDALRAKLALRLPQSALALDLDAIRTAAEHFDAVDRAVVRLGADNVLQISITERQPAWVWRTEGGLILLDDAGHRVAGLAARADRADLPLIAGEGADQAIAEAKAILAAADPLANRIRGLIRISTRRWDLVLDRDQRILLPADNPLAAVDALLALNAGENLLARDILSVDLRNPQRPVLRLAPTALDAMRAAQGITVSTEPKS